MFAGGDTETGKVGRGHKVGEIELADGVLHTQTQLALRIGGARHGPRVARQTGDSVRAAKGPEVLIEGAVLLHDDHDVLDLVQLARRER